MDEEMIQAMFEEDYDLDDDFRPPIPEWLYALLLAAYSKGAHAGWGQGFDDGWGAGYKRGNHG